MAKKRMSGSREARKPKQIKVKKVEASSVSELSARAGIPAKRR